MLHITILPLKQSSGFKTFILPCVRNVRMNLIALSPGFLVLHPENQTLKQRWEWPGDAAMNLKVAHNVFLLILCSSFSVCMVQVVLRVSPTRGNRKEKFNRFHFLTLPHPHWEQLMMLSPMHLCPNGQAWEVQSPGGEATAACVRFLVFCRWSRMIQLEACWPICTWDFNFHSGGGIPGVPLCTCLLRAVCVSGR